MAAGQDDLRPRQRGSFAARLFTDHPHSLGMNWAQHGAGAVRIGARLLGAGAACVVHALVPGWFTQTAGRTIASLHQSMLDRRAGAANPDEWPDYEI